MSKSTEEPATLGEMLTAVDRWCENTEPDSPMSVGWRLLRTIEMKGARKFVNWYYDQQEFPSHARPSGDVPEANYEAWLRSLSRCNLVNVALHRPTLEAIADVLEARSNRELDSMAKDVLIQRDAERMKELEGQLRDALLELGGIQSTIAEELNLDRTPVTASEVREALRHDKQPLMFGSLEDYEANSGLRPNDAFRTGWRMARMRMPVQEP